MRRLTFGLFFALSACVQPAGEGQEATHICTTSPIGLVECHETG